MPIRCCPERKTCEMKAEKTFNPVQHTKILENILKGWSSLTQGKLRISQSIFQHFKRQSKHKHQARGAAQAVRPPAYSERNYFAQDRREKPGRGDGRPNLKLSGSREEDRQGHDSTLNSTTNNNSNNSTAQENTRNQGRHLGVVSTEGSNTFRQAIRHPKEAEAKNLFNPSRLYAEGEKVYGFYSEEIHS